MIADTSVHAKHDRERPISFRRVAQVAFWVIFGILVLASLLYIAYWLGYHYEMSKLHDIPGVKPYEVTP